VGSLPKTSLLRPVLVNAPISASKTRRISVSFEENHRQRLLEEKKMEEMPLGLRP